MRYVGKEGDAKTTLEDIHVVDLESGNAAGKLR